MSQKVRIVLSLVVIILIAFILYGLFSSNPQDKIEHEDAKSASEKWSEYRPQSGLFTARLPSIPQHVSEQIMIPDTNAVVQYSMYLAQSPTGSTILINIIEYPPSFDTENSNSLLEGIVQAMSEPDALVTRSNGTFLQHLSIDFRIKTRDGELFAKVFAVSKKIYVLSVIDQNAERGKAVFERLVAGFTPVSMDFLGGNSPE